MSSPWFYCSPSPWGRFCGVCAPSQCISHTQVCDHSCRTLSEACCGFCRGDWWGTWPDPSTGVSAVLHPSGGASGEFHSKTPGRRGTTWLIMTCSHHRYHRVLLKLDIVSQLLVATQRQHPPLLLPWVTEIYLFKINLVDSQYSNIVLLTWFTRIWFR